MPLFLFISNALQVHGWELVRLPLLCASPSPNSLPTPIGDISSRGFEQIYYRNQAALAMVTGGHQNSLRKNPGRFSRADFAPGGGIDAAPVTYLEG